MRIVQVITRPQRRGAELFAVQLSEELIKLGHQVILITLFKSEQALDFLGDQINLDLDYRGKIDLLGFKSLAKKLKEINPDIVQANASETLRMCVGASFFYKGHYSLIYRNANQISSFLKGRGSRLWNKFLLSKVDGICSVSEASRLDLDQTFGLNKPITTIPIGIDPKQINQRLTDPSPLIPSPYLIQIGSLVPEKDPLGMLDIFRELTFPNLKLVFLGSGPLESELNRKIQDDQLQDRVKLVPNQANIFPYLKYAAALVMPSKVEGLPGVILEAMYCQVPGIAYGVGGIPEILLNQQTGYCIPPGDPKLFQQVITEVLNAEPINRSIFLANAHQLILQKFTISQVSQQFEDFYQRMLK